MFSSLLPSPGTLMVRGIVALLFGIVALLLPRSALLGLVIAFGVYAFIDGVLALAAAITRRDYEGRGWLAIEGIAGLITGILAFARPGLALITLVAAWAFVTGIMKIVVLAIRLRREISGEWLLVLGGVASIVLAGLIIPLDGLVDGMTITPL